MSKQTNSDPAAPKDGAKMDCLAAKKQKSVMKAKLTRCANELVTIIDQKQDIELLKAARIKHNEAKDAVVAALMQLTQIYENLEDADKAEKSMDEIDTVLDDYKSTEKRVQQYYDNFNRSNGDNTTQALAALSLDNDRPNTSTTAEPPQQKIGQDMWRQLERVSVPKFNGSQSAYPSWKAAFKVCIDDAPATPVYKLLQLKQCLQGEPLKIIERLGHSADAYAAAKDCLDRKYGGERRLVSMYLNELENFRPIKEGQTKAFEKFADILNVAIVNLKEAGRVNDLNSVSLHSRLQQKLPESILVNYRRWLLENKTEESVERLRDFVVRETEFYAVARDTLVNSSRKDESQAKFNNRTFLASSNKNFRSVPPRDLCAGCRESHPIWKCKEFLQLTVPNRWDVAKQKGLCFRCLGTNHLGRSCTKGRQCGIDGCTLQHNRLLHSTQKREEITPVKANAPVDANTEQSDTAFFTHSRFIALRTVPVVIRHGQRALKVNALLDDASTRSYLNSDVAGELGIQGTLARVSVGVLNGQVETFETCPVKVQLESLDGKVRSTISALTTNRVTGSLQVIDWRNQRHRWRHLQNIPFPSTAEKPYVDVLLGADYLDLQCSLQEVKGAAGEPIARKTPLGWTCVGDPALPSSSSNKNGSSHFTLHSQTVEMLDIDRNLRRFWETEEIGPETWSDPFSQKEKTVIENTKESIRYEDGRYKVAVPWKEEKKTLNSDSYAMARNRLNNTEKGLVRRPEVGKEYCRTIEKYIEKGYVVKKENRPSKEEVSWYLPHFPVVRQDKETTKVRIVFDASAKCQGISLNDMIDPGPKLQSDLFSILVNFRKHEIALVCDISEMYLQIELFEADRRLHRFLWRNLESDRDPDVYEFQRLVFGVNASPFLAQLVLREHANATSSSLSQASNAILNATYMDDTMTSLIDEQQAYELYEQMVTLLGQAGMRPHKWLTNSKRVLQALPPEDRKLKWTIEDDTLPTAKTLGVVWEAENDQFTYSGQNLLGLSVSSKRTFLKVIARLFDPLGLLAPYIVRAKVLLQKLWTAGYDWDEDIDEELLQEIRLWTGELASLQLIKIPRCVKATGNNVLHVFVDASSEAFAATCFLRSIDNDDSVTVRLVAAKSKVAPIAATSIPRLELMAAVLGLKLAKSVGMSFNVTTSDIVFWSDSMTVLWWIRGHSRNFKPFVANRISEIQAVTNPSQWRYVPTGENVADHATRGLTVAALAKCDAWWQGPSFLSAPNSEWPETKMFAKDEAAVEKKRHSTKMKIDRTLLSNVTASIQDANVWRLKPERFSKWMRLVHVRCWVKRFIDNCRLPPEQRVLSGLTLEEICDQETAIIVEAQRFAYPKEYTMLSARKTSPPKHELLSLNPKIDDVGLLRCDSRLQFAEQIPHRSRFPIILPRKSAVTRLIISHYDALGNHALGTNHILANLQEKFWVVRGREAVKEWENLCNSCARRKAKPAWQIMAPLPKCRFQEPLRAFARVAVDYAGPYFTIQGRARKRQKRYLCLFTCLACRAVHLEMSFSLTTDSFLNSFYRMVSRRGLPLEVISDNGLNFVGAKNELAELFKILIKIECLNV